MNSYRKDIFENYRAIFSDWLPKGSSIAIAIGNRFVYFASGHSQITLEVGSLVPKESLAYRVLHEQIKLDSLMDTSLFNTPYYAIGYPLIIEGERAALIIVLPPLFKSTPQEPLTLLTGRIEDDWIPVDILDITYFESLQKKTWFYNMDNQFKTSITLKELELKLPKYFIRIHRSYIVNVKFISKITKDYSSNLIVHLKNGAELPVSQSYASSLKQLLGI